MLVLYSRPGCLFCKQVGDLFTEEGLPHQTVVITDLARQNELIGKTDTKSFPLVFFGQQFVGGFTHVVFLHSMGRLKELLVEPNAPGTTELPTPLTTFPKPTAAPSKPSVVGGARDEIAGFARWGAYLRDKGKKP